MRTIHKFTLSITDSQLLTMPKGAIILHVNTQRGALCLWAEVFSDAPPDARIIKIVGTGNPMPAAHGVLTYIGTAHLGPFVWHVYEDKL